MKKFLLGITVIVTIPIWFPVMALALFCWWMHSMGDTVLYVWDDCKKELWERRK